MVSWSKWYHHVLGNPDSIDAVIEACTWYEREIEEAVKELETDGVNIEALELKIPGLLAHRFNQLQEIEGIFKVVEHREDILKSKHFRNFTEHYARTLSDRTAEKYAEGMTDVNEWRACRLHVSHIRNLYLGYMKGLESLNFRISDVVKLRIAGIEDSTL